MKELKVFDIEMKSDRDGSRTIYFSVAGDKFPVCCSQSMTAPGFFKRIENIFNMAYGPRFTMNIDKGTITVGDSV